MFNNMFRFFHDGVLAIAAQVVRMGGTEVIKPFDQRQLVGVAENLEKQGLTRPVSQELHHISFGLVKPRGSAIGKASRRIDRFDSICSLLADTMPTRNLLMILFDQPFKFREGFRSRQFTECKYCPKSHFWRWIS